MMDVREQTTLAVPIERAWPYLRDVHVVAGCLPGAHLTGPGDEGGWDGRMDVRFGPTRAIFSGHATFDVDDDDHRVRVRGRGRDQRGRTRAAVDVLVAATEEASGHTGLSIDGTIDVAGALAHFAETGGAHLARELMRTFATDLAAHVEQAVDGADGTGEAEVVDAADVHAGSRVAHAAPRSDGTATLSVASLAWSWARGVLRRLARTMRRRQDDR